MTLSVHSSELATPHGRARAGLTCVKLCWSSSAWLGCCASGRRQPASSAHRAPLTRARALRSCCIRSLHQHTTYLVDRLMLRRNDGAHREAYTIPYPVGIDPPCS